MKVAAAILAILALAAVVTACISAVRMRSFSAPAEERRMLNAYTKLTLLAARASRKGFTGEANIYQESADRMIEAWEAKEDD